nr:amino acid permease [Gammaproteobacteria bacterium]
MTTVRRSISTLSLLFASVSAILGSGWLFAAYYTSRLAGPASILAWFIGGLLLVVIAFGFAELSSMLPITGSSTRIPQYTHGTIVSFIFSWMIWLSYMTMVPTEVQAVMQYLSYFYANLTHKTGGLTTDGYLVATGFMFILSVINIYSV